MENKYTKLIGSITGKDYSARVDNTTTSPSNMSEQVHNYRYENDPKYKFLTDLHQEDKPLEGSVLDPIGMGLGVGAAGKVLEGAGVGATKYGKFLADNPSTWRNGMVDTSGLSAGNPRINITYSTEEALAKLPNTKMTKEQVGAFLKSKDVPVNQVHMALHGLPDDKIALGDQWSKQIRANGNYKVHSDPVDTYKYDSILMKGSNRNTYETTLQKLNQSAVPRHPAASDYETTHYKDIPNYAGHQRITTENIGGRKSRVIQEYQNDWTQSERTNDLSNLKVQESSAKNPAKLKSRIKKAQDELDKLNDEYLDLRNKPRRTDAAKESLAKLYKLRKEAESKLEHADYLYEEAGRANRTIYEANTGESLGEVTSKFVPNFPIKDKVARQGQLVTEFKKAMENGDEQILIPIKRQGSLVGSKVVTQSYVKNVPSDLKAVQAKLKAKGIETELILPKKMGGIGEEKFSYTSNLQANLAEHEYIMVRQLEMLDAFKAQLGKAGLSQPQARDTLEVIHGLDKVLDADYNDILANYEAVKKPIAEYKRKYGADGLTEKFDWITKNIISESPRHENTLWGLRIKPGQGHKTADYKYWGLAGGGAGLGAASQEQQGKYDNITQ